MIEIRARTTEPVSMVYGVGSSSSASPLKLTLVFQDRQRSRLRVLLSDGKEAALLLARGTVLRGGDALALSDGRIALVEAAPEGVSTVRAEGLPDPVLALSRAAYHLGNRHVPLQVGSGFLRYLHDHVLDAMVTELGLSVLREDAPFEPESGAYGRHTHGPGQAHGHSHSHQHDEGERAIAHGVRRALGLVELDRSEPSAERSADTGQHVR